MKVGNSSSPQGLTQANDKATGVAPKIGPGQPDEAFHLMPWSAVRQLNLTEEQRQQIAFFEKEAKEKLKRVLCPEPLKAVQEARPRSGPGEPGTGTRADNVPPKQ